MAARTEYFTFLFALHVWLQWTAEGVDFLKMRNSLLAVLEKAFKNSLCYLVVVVQSASQTTGYTMTHHAELHVQCM